MATAISSQYQEFSRIVARLDQVTQSVDLLPAEIRYMVGELAILQTAVAIERLNESTFLRLICGARLSNGRLAGLNCPKKKSLNEAEQAVRSFGRNKKRTGYLNWLAETELKSNTEKVFDVSEPVTQIPARYSTELSEIKAIRNYVAHQSSRAKIEYAKTVQSQFGPSSITVRPGKLLFREHASGLRLINYYLLATRLYGRDLVMG